MLIHLVFIISINNIRLLEAKHLINLEGGSDAVRIRILASVLLPLAGMFFRKKKALIHVPFYIIRENLKLPNKDAEQISGIVLKYYKGFGLLANGGPKDRVRAGLLLRSTGTLWQVCSDLAQIDEDLEIEKGIEKYDLLAEWFRSENLLGVWDLKPLVNGKDIMKELHVKPGPFIKVLSDATIRWQLENPTGTKQECLIHLASIQQY